MPGRGPLTLSAQAEVRFQLLHAAQQCGVRPVPPQRVPGQRARVLRGPARDSAASGPGARRGTPGRGRARAGGAAGRARARGRGGGRPPGTAEGTPGGPAPEEPLLGLALRAEAHPRLHGAPDCGQQRAATSGGVPEVAVGQRETSATWRVEAARCRPPHRLLPLAGRAGARPQGSKQRLRLGHCNSPRLNPAEEPSDWPDSRSSSRPLVPTPASAALRFDSLFAITVSAALQLAAAPEAPPPSRVPHSRLAPARRELPSAFTLLRRSPTPIGPPPSSSPPTPRISALGLVSPSPPRPSSPSAHPIGHRRPLSPPPRRGDLHAHWPRAP